LLEASSDPLAVNLLQNQIATAIGQRVSSRSARAVIAFVRRQTGQRDSNTICDASGSCRRNADEMTAVAIEAVNRLALRANDLDHAASPPKSIEYPGEMAHNQ
jgi:hypothetical protein